MNRTVLGAFAALLLAAAGLFWWQGRATVDAGKLPPVAPAPTGDPLSLPEANGAGLRGPELPQATEQTKEQRRFDRLDRDRNGRISRVEMLAPRAVMFRKLDVDGNNLLTFEEWAVVTGNRFKAADANGDGQLDRIEFATTKPKPHLQPQCKCSAKPLHGVGKRSAPPPEPESDEDRADEGEPAP